MPANIRLKVSTPPPIKLRYIEAVTKPEVEKTVAPTYEGVEVTPPSGATLSKVTVEPIPDPTEEETYSANGDYNVSRIGTAHVRVPQPSGKVIITENGRDVDIHEYESADIAVPQGIFPSGTKQISITQNGTTTENVSEYAEVEITVNTLPTKGIVFGDYDADGFPTTARTVGMTALSYYAWQASGVTHLTFGDKITSIYMYNSPVANITFPDNDITLGYQALMGTKAKDYIFKKNVTFSGNGQQMRNLSNALQIVFGGDLIISTGATTNIAWHSNNKCMLYDFSHCTTIPPLFSAESLGHASGCVIRIPAALSDTTLGVGNGWESATNWSALTNIVWEVG